MVANTNVIALEGRQNNQSACQACLRRASCPVLNLTGAGPGHTPGHSMLTFRSNESVVEAGQPFKGLYMVRSGFFKSSFIDASGEMQVTGFHFPGEIFGLDGIDKGQYGDTVVALDTGSVCRIPLSVFTDSAAGSEDQESVKACMMTLVNLMSGAISRDRNMIFNLGRMDAKRRFATFLLDIADRMQRSGYDGDAFSLCMSRIDIANYLCLALETISRLFSQFHANGIIHVERRELKIADREALLALAADQERPAQARKAG